MLVLVRDSGSALVLVVLLVVGFTLVLFLQRPTASVPDHLPAHRLWSEELPKIAPARSKQEVARKERSKVGDSTSEGKGVATRHL